MKINGYLIACFTAMSLPVSADENADRVAESRGVVGEIVEELKNLREKAVEENGPGQAVEVCSTKAPEILKRYGADRGWTIKRTSLQLRNPDNAPDAWEEAALKAFAARKAKGESIYDMEQYEVVTMDGTKAFRYMQALPMGGFCTNCHGAKTAQGVAPKLDELYPQDKARGYNVGDLRGGYSIVQPLK